VGPRVAVAVCGRLGERALATTNIALALHEAGGCGKGDEGLTEVCNHRRTRWLEAWSYFAIEHHPILTCTGTVPLYDTVVRTD